MSAATGLGRRSLLALAVYAPLAQVRAGALLEEPLADAVRTALSAAVHNSAPPVPEFADAAAQKAVLLAACAEGQLCLDVSPGQPSASALQLVIAAAKTLSLDGRFSGFGPNVGPYLDPILNAS